jgi:spore coat polysaccharide biosynthesis protein SpsF
VSTIIIVQARMTSTRLPGKVLKEVLGKSLLEYQIERLRQSRRADNIVIATTTNSTDEPIVQFCRRADVDLFRGSEEDVLARYRGAAAVYNASVIVRVTSDCPLIDPEIIDRAINRFTSLYNNVDYVSNTLLRTYPRGLDVEVFSRDILEEAFTKAADRAEREHVTPYIYYRPEKFRLANLAQDTDMSWHRWTVDTQEDFELIRMMLESLYPVNPRFRLADCMALIDRHPEWSEINRNIRQKALHE